MGFEGVELCLSAGFRLLIGASFVTLSPTVWQPGVLDDEEREYEEASEQLFSAIDNAICAAANDSSSE